MVGVCNGTGLFDGKCFPMAQSVRSSFPLSFSLDHLLSSILDIPQQIDAFPNIDLVLPTAGGDSFAVTMKPENYILENTVRSSISISRI